MKDAIYGAQRCMGTLSGRQPSTFIDGRDAGCRSAAWDLGFVG